MTTQEQLLFTWDFMYECPSDSSSGYLALGLASSCPGWMSPPEQILGDQGRLLPGLGSWNPFIQKNPLRTQYLPFPSPSCALNWSSAVGGQVLFCSSDIVYQVPFSPLVLSH
ncbi:unnamed protein product [Prunus armeniaca]